MSVINEVAKLFDLDIQDQDFLQAYPQRAISYALEQYKRNTQQKAPLNPYSYFKGILKNYSQQHTIDQQPVARQPKKVNSAPSNSYFHVNGHSFHNRADHIRYLHNMSEEEYDAMKFNQYEQAKHLHKQIYGE